MHPTVVEYYQVWFQKFRNSVLDLKNIVSGSVSCGETTVQYAFDSVVDLERFFIPPVSDYGLVIVYTC